MANTFHWLYLDNPNEPLLMDHLTGSWAATTSYVVNQTVFDSNATWICHENITGDAANVRPAISDNWALYAGGGIAIGSTLLTNTGDILYKVRGATAALRLGTDNSILHRAPSGLSWQRIGAGDGREAGALRVPSLALPTSEKYAFREGLDGNRALWEVCDYQFRPSGANVLGAQQAGSAGRTAIQTARYQLTPVSNQLLQGMFNSAYNNVFPTPNNSDAGLRSGVDEESTANRARIVDGRFFHDNESNVYGGVLNIDKVNVGTLLGSTAQPRSSSIFLMNLVDERYGASQVIREATKLADTTTDNSSPLMLDLNFDQDTLEWKIFNEVAAPYNRNLHVIDYVRTKDDTFVYLCAPADDINNVNARTIWEIGGVVMRSSNNDSASLLCHKGYTLSPGTSAASPADGLFTQFAALQPPQFSWRNRELTQIAAAGAYERLFLVDVDGQYNSPFFIPAESLTNGATVAVKMVDGTFQLHGGQISDTQRTATSTAIVTYPASVTTRDHFCVNDFNRNLYTASHVAYHGTSGSFTSAASGRQNASLPALALSLHFNAWKSGDSEVSIRYGRGNPDPATTALPLGTLTIPGTETIKQIKCFVWWAQVTSGGTTGNTHPTSSGSTPNLVVFVVTDAGNLYIAGHHNELNPLTDDTTEASLTVPVLPTNGQTVAMVQLSGAWDGNVKEIHADNSFEELIAQTRPGSAIGNNGYTIDSSNNYFNRVIIACNDGEFYLHQTNRTYSATLGSNRDNTYPQNRFALFYEGSIETLTSFSSTNPNVRSSMFNLAEGSLGGTYFSGSLGGQQILARWTKGVLPAGEIERIIPSAGGRFFIANDFGAIYESDAKNVPTGQLFSGSVPINLTSFAGGLGQFRLFESYFGAI